MIVKQDDIVIDYSIAGLDEPLITPSVTSYILDNEGCYQGQKRPAVIICPGGGYDHLATHEGEPVAVKFNSSGFHAFVLKYSVSPMRFPGALLELSKAVAMVRNAGEKYNIDTDKIIVCGFSAGGHLAASLGVYWHEGFIQRVLGIDNNENQPNGLILCYPVISNKSGLIHLGSMQNLLGKYPDEKEIEMFSLEDNINDLVPPVFIWHNYDDSCVPVENTLVFANALKQHDIPLELHIYSKGEHGIGLANEVTAQFLGQIVPRCQNWIDMAIKFAQDL